MKIVADESVEMEIVRALRKGHTVRAIGEESPGLMDAEVLSVSLMDDAVLVTSDKDFGELIHPARSAKQNRFRFCPGTDARPSKARNPARRHGEARRAEPWRPQNETVTSGHLATPI